MVIEIKESKTVTETRERTESHRWRLGVSHTVQLSGQTQDSLDFPSIDDPSIPRAFLVQVAARVLGLLTPEERGEVLPRYVEVRDVSDADRERARQDRDAAIARAESAKRELSVCRRYIDTADAERHKLRDLLEAVRPGGLENVRHDVAEPEHAGGETAEELFGQGRKPGMPENAEQIAWDACGLLPYVMSPKTARQWRDRLTASIDRFARRFAARELRRLVAQGGTRFTRRDLELRAEELERD